MWPLTNIGIDGLLSSFYKRYKPSRADIQKKISVAELFTIDTTLDPETQKKKTRYNTLVTMLKTLKIKGRDDYTFEYDYNILFAWYDPYSQRTEPRIPLQDCMFFMNLIYKCKYNEYKGCHTPLKYPIKFETSKKQSGDNKIKIMIIKNYDDAKLNKISQPLNDSNIYDAKIVNLTRYKQSTFNTLQSFIKFMESQDEMILNVTNKTSVSPYLKYGYKLDHSEDDNKPIQFNCTDQTLDICIKQSGLALHKSYMDILITCHESIIKSFIISLKTTRYDKKKITTILYQLYALCNSTTSSSPINSLFIDHLKQLDDAFVETFVYSKDEIVNFGLIDKLIAIYVSLLVLIYAQRLNNASVQKIMSLYGTIEDLYGHGDKKISYTEMHKYSKICNNTYVQMAPNSDIPENDKYETITALRLHGYIKLPPDTVAKNIICNSANHNGNIVHVPLLYSDLIMLICKNVKKISNIAGKIYLPEHDKSVTKIDVLIDDKPTVIYEDPTSDSDNRIFYYPFSSCNTFGSFNWSLTRDFTTYKEDLGKQYFQVNDMKFWLPNIKNNPFLLGEFKWSTDDPKTYYVGARHKNSEYVHKDYNFQLLVDVPTGTIYRLHVNDIVINSNDFTIIKTKMNTLPQLVLDVRSDVSGKFAGLEHTTGLVLFWKSGTNISHIDLLSYGCYLTVKHPDTGLFINDEYQIIDSTDWMLQRWASCSYNTYLTKTKTGAHYLATFTGPRYAFKEIKKFYSDDGTAFLNKPHDEDFFNIIESRVHINVYFTAINPMTKIPIISNDTHTLDKTYALIYDYIQAYALTNLFEIIHTAQKNPLFEKINNYKGIFKEIIAVEQSSANIFPTKFWNKIPHDLLIRSLITNKTLAIEASIYKIADDVHSYLQKDDYFNGLTLLKSTESKHFMVDTYKQDNIFWHVALRMYAFISSEKPNQFTLRETLISTGVKIDIREIYESTDYYNGLSDYKMSPDKFKKHKNKSILGQIVEKWEDKTTIDPTTRTPMTIIEPKYVDGHTTIIAKNNVVLSVLYSLINLLPKHKPKPKSKSTILYTDKKRVEFRAHNYDPDSKFSFEVIDNPFNVLDSAPIDEVKGAAAETCKLTRMDTYRDTVIKNYLFMESENETYRYAPTLLEYYSHSLFMCKSDDPRSTKAGAGAGAGSSASVGKIQYEEGDSRYNAFWWYFQQLIWNYVNIKIENEPDLVDDLKQILQKYKRNVPYDENLIEFAFQFISGQFARPEQLDFVAEVTHDLLRKRTSGSTFIYDNTVRGETSTFTNPMIFYGTAEKIGSALAKINDSSDKQDFKGCGRVHNMLMGGGKTSTITPLTILRYIRHTLHYLEKAKHDLNIYLVLPEKLVRDSHKALTELIGTYFPIDVKWIREDRKFLHQYTQSLKIGKNHRVTIYIMNDTTMKCGFLKNDAYPIILDKSSDNAYLFDEIDTILNPITSELNFPREENLEPIRLFDVFYDYMYKVLHNIFKDNWNTIYHILKDHSTSYDTIPHFNIINASDTTFITKIQDYAKNIALRTFDNTNVTAFIHHNSSPGTPTQDEINLLYNYYSFINDVLPTALLFVNRKNYGIGNGKHFDGSDDPAAKPYAIPFAAAEQPSEGSDFNSPLLTTALTILAYKLNKKQLPKFALDKLLHYISTSYSAIPPQSRAYNELSIALVDIFGGMQRVDVFINTLNATNSELLKLSSNDVIVKLFCKYLCSGIKISTIQDSVAGIDLIMASNNRYKSGFTGTPNMPKFYDNTGDNTGISDVAMGIKTLSTKTVDTIKTAMEESDVLVIGDKLDGNSQEWLLYDALKACIVTHPTSYHGVLIDIGAVLVGMDAYDVFNLIKKVRPYNTQLKRFIFWDKDDIAMVIDNDNHTRQWDRQMPKKGDNDTFYYYDNQHIVGTDAKIPADFRGLALIGKTSRYRDVVQGIFRMRKLTKGQRVTFVVPEKVSRYINDKVTSYARKDIHSGTTTLDDIRQKVIGDGRFPTILTSHGPTLSGGAETHKLDTVRSMAKTLVGQMDEITRLQNLLGFTNGTSSRQSTLSLITDFTNSLLGAFIKNSSADDTSILFILSSTIGNILNHEILNYFADTNNINTIPDDKLQNLVGAFTNVVSNLPEEVVKLSNYHEFTESLISGFVPKGTTEMGALYRSLQFVIPHNPTYVLGLMIKCAQLFSSDPAPSIVSTMTLSDLYDIFILKPDYLMKQIVINDMMFLLPKTINELKILFTNLNTLINSLPQYKLFNDVRNALHDKINKQHPHPVGIINFCKDWVNLTTFHNSYDQDKKYQYKRSDPGWFDTDMVGIHKAKDITRIDSLELITLFNQIPDSSGVAQWNQIYSDLKSIETLDSYLHRPNISIMTYYSEIFRKYIRALTNLKNSFIDDLNVRDYTIDEHDFEGLIMDMIKLRTWFEIEEREFIERQQQTMKIHNARALTRKIIQNRSSSVSFSSDGIMYSRTGISPKPFTCFNTFKYPNVDKINIIKYLQSGTQALIDEMNDIALLITDSTITDNLKISPDTQIVAGSVQRVTVTQAQQAAIGSHMHSSKLPPICLDKFDDFINKDAVQTYGSPYYQTDITLEGNGPGKSPIYTISTRNIFYSHNLHTTSFDDNSLFRDTFFVLYNPTDKQIFIITTLEGFKLLDNMMHNKKDNIYIFDTLGNSYWNSNKSPQKVLKPIIQIINKGMFPFKHMSISDYKTLFTTTIPDRLQYDILQYDIQILLSNALTSGIHTEIHKKFATFYTEYIKNYDTLYPILIKCLNYTKDSDATCDTHVNRILSEEEKIARFAPDQKILIKDIVNLLTYERTECSPIMSGGGHRNTRIIKLANRLFVF